MHEKVRRGEAKLLISVKQLIHHYNCGDLKEVLFSQEISNIANVSQGNSFQKEQTKAFKEYMREQLLFKRNQKMARRIVKIINEKPGRSMIFASGAGDGSI